MSRFSFFATAPRNLEALLADELTAIGLEEVRQKRGGVAFAGPLVAGYRAVLWSRIANRILLPLAVFPAPDSDALYSGACAVDWSEHLDPASTFAVDASISSSQIKHSHFAALRIKDAIVDSLRSPDGRRPSVDTDHPGLRVNLYLHRDQAVLSLDLSGESLHRRGYRQETVAAPVKENLAAAILLRCDWPQIAASGGNFVDPMCGSGTFVIEAAMIAADIAPGLYRDQVGMAGWRQHDDSLWKELVSEARQRRETGLRQLPQLCGYDRDPAAIRAARINADQAGFGGRLRFQHCDLEKMPALAATGSGLMVVNPPYGERLGEKKDLAPLYALLGRRLRSDFVGWQAAVLTANTELAREMAIRPIRQTTLFNGPLECRLLIFDIEPERFYGAATRPEGVDIPLSPGAEMVANRLRKNLKSLSAWVKRENIDAYRVYDADIPEYAAAIDLYAGRVHVQEYEAPKTVDDEKARQRLGEVLQAVRHVFAAGPDEIYLKVRRRQKGKDQYTRLGAEQRTFAVQEGGAQLLVNLGDYLDTGLFLDHRPTRLMIRELARNKHFLNLFCYTGAATVHAALGGARSTTSVDLSRTYLDWAKRNLMANSLGTTGNELVQADCREWLKKETRLFDLIFLDPPTFSNSKSMNGTFDVQRDQVELLRSAARRLSPEGILIFSNNNRRFRLDADALPELEIENISAKTIPPDFVRNQRIHNCWRITLKKSS